MLTLLAKPISRADGLDAEPRANGALGPSAIGEKGEGGGRLDGAEGHEPVDPVIQLLRRSPMASLAPAPAHSPRPVSSPYRVDVSRGTSNSRVSSEWFSRPDDERFLSLGDLYDNVRSRAERSHTRIIESRAIKVEARRDEPERLALILPENDMPVAPTNWSFGQLCSLVGAPASYMRDLPAPLAGINLQYGLQNHRGEHVKLLQSDLERTELRSVTSESYGRIWDHQLIEAIMRFAGNGTGDTRWKAPGVLDWRTMHYNPYVDVSKDTTTFYASDRDVFVFLVDDTHPIEAGKLPNGEPDLFFRGFYAWNSEVGAKTLGIATFYLRRLRQSDIVGGREFRGDQDPAFQVRRRTFRPSGRTSACTLCRRFAANLHRRDQDRP